MSRRPAILAMSKVHNDGNNKHRHLQENSQEEPRIPFGLISIFLFIAIGSCCWKCSVRANASVSSSRPQVTPSARTSQSPGQAAESSSSPPITQQGVAMKLTPTTMQVSKADLVQRDLTDCRQDKADDVVMTDIEMGKSVELNDCQDGGDGSCNIDEGELKSGAPVTMSTRSRNEGLMLRLQHTSSPDQKQEGNVLVPANCALCLASYKFGEEVSWFDSCLHAFHTSCLTNCAVMASNNSTGSQNELCRQPYISYK